MDFLFIIKNCFSNYFNFSGRASRTEFWYFTSFLIIVSIIMDVIDASLKDLTYWTYDEMMGPSQSIFTLITIIPQISVATRRLHDINTSGWIQLLALTIIGNIPLFIWLSTQSDKDSNKYGSVSPNTSESDFKPISKSIKFFVIPICSIIFIVIICFAFLGSFLGL